MRNSASTLAAAALLAGCTTTVVDAQPIGTAGSPEIDGRNAGFSVDAQFDRWIDAFESGDASALSLLFSEDGIYAPNTGQVFRGRAAIRAGVDAWFKGPLVPAYQPGGPKVAVERSPLRVEHVDGAAYMLNRFVVRLAPPGCVLDIGHILLVWRRQASGEWLIDLMLGNQDKQPFPNGCVQ